MTTAIALGLVNLLLYCAQQFGMAFGVGAETVLLIAHLQTLRDGVIDDEEKRFARAIRAVRFMGLLLIIGSGAGIIASGFMATSTVPAFSTIFLFKWSLIGIVLALSLIPSLSVWASLLQGLAAGTWYALFVVHILAPSGTWLMLGEIYGGWLLGFMIIWTVFVFALKGKSSSALVAKVATERASAAAKVLPKPAVVVMPDTKKVWPFARKKDVAQAADPVPAQTPVPTPPSASVPTPIAVPVPPPAPVPVVAAPAQITVMPSVPTMPTPPVKPPAPPAPDAPIAAASIVPPSPPTPTQPQSASLPTPPAPPAPSAAPVKQPNAPEFMGLHVMPRSPNEVDQRQK